MDPIITQIVTSTGSSVIAAIVYIWVSQRDQRLLIQRLEKDTEALAKDLEDMQRHREQDERSIRDAISAIQVQLAQFKGIVDTLQKVVNKLDSKVFQ